MPNTSPKVFIVGAGPGDPGCLTVRALECLALAEVVIHDRLVPMRILDYAPMLAERICVTDFPGPHPERVPQIIELLIEKARSGKRVVRLKGGDPLFFGRGVEELEALRAAAVDYEVVPGVTSGLAAAAFSGIPLTHRRNASAVAFVTGHEDPSKPTGLDWNALAKFPGTLVIYMGMSRLPQIVEKLLACKKNENTPAAAIQWAGLGSQRTVEARLSRLPVAVQEAGLTSPAIILVGEAVAMRQHLSWLERRPLFGKRILLTRPRQQAITIARQLELRGAIPYCLPVVEIHEPADWSPVDKAIAEIAHYQWLVFTSANGVHYFIHRLCHIGFDLRSLGQCKLAVIGPATQEALASYHLSPDLVPSTYRSEALAESLKEPAKGKRVLLLRADRGRDILREELTRVARVEQVAVYSQADAVDRESHEKALLRNGDVDFVTLTSSNIAKAFHRCIGSACQKWIASGRVQIVSLSPVTSQAIRDLGMPVAAEAKVYTMKGLIDALVSLAGSR